MTNTPILTEQLQQSQTAAVDTVAEVLRERAALVQALGERRAWILWQVQEEAFGLIARELAAKLEESDQPEQEMGLIRGAIAECQAYILNHRLIRRELGDDPALEQGLALTSRQFLPYLLTVLTDADSICPRG